MPAQIIRNLCPASVENEIFRTAVGHEEDWRRAGIGSQPAECIETQLRYDRG